MLKGKLTYDISLHFLQVEFIAWEIVNGVHISTDMKEFTAAYLYWLFNIKNNMN
jgi:hypothetical protein